MSATWADIDEATRELADFPNWQHPNFQVRMSAYIRAARYFTRRAQAAPTTKYINQFTLDVFSGENEYNVPRDDFNGISSCVADPTQFPNEPIREIDVIQFSDTDLHSGAGGIGSSSNSRVRYISVREDLEPSTGQVTIKLVTFPRGCTDHLIVYYRVLPNRNASVADMCPLDEATALALIPAHAISQKLGYSFVWDTYQEGEDLMTKREAVREMADKILQSEIDIFEQEIFYPNRVQPSQQLQGSSSRRRLRRYSRGIR